MKKKLLTLAIAATVLSQSTATFADPPSSYGLCAWPQMWSPWLPCFTVQGGNSIYHAH